MNSVHFVNCYRLLQIHFQFTQMQSEITHFSLTKHKTVHSYMFEKKTNSNKYKDFVCHEII